MRVPRKTGTYVLKGDGEEGPLGRDPGIAICSGRFGAKKGAKHPNGRACSFLAARGDGAPGRAYCDHPGIGSGETPLIVTNWHLILRMSLCMPTERRATFFVAGDDVFHLQRSFRRGHR